MPVKLLFSLLLLLQFTALKSQVNWEFSTEKEEVKVYTKDNANSSIKASKATMVVNSSLQKAVDFLKDYEGFPNWMYECTASKLLKMESDVEYYLYMVINAPWPIRDRDLIVHGIGELLADSTVVLNMVGKAEYIAEKSGLVRVPEFKGSWIIKRLSDEQIEITYELHTSPGGFIPAWLANMTATDTPLYTLIEMKKELER